jgi:hypothetical protein
VGKSLNAKHICKDIFPVYDGKYLLGNVVHSWVEKFCQGSSKIADDVRPGNLLEIAAEATGQRVEVLIRADSRTTIDSVATAAFTVSTRCPVPISIRNTR